MSTTAWVHCASRKSEEKDDGAGGRQRCEPSLAVMNSQLAFRSESNQPIQALSIWSVITRRALSRVPLTLSVGAVSEATSTCDVSTLPEAGRGFSASC